ncbi:MAG: hypothetical protein MJY68_08820 [Bacteroidaceae bacterium]|nr:hypothetical protein [Bacteroidaceae bacterium]
MKIRRIRIWLSRGWYRILCSVSLLLLPLFTSCSSSKSASKNAGTNNSEVAENKETDMTAQDGISVLFNSNDGSSMRLMYGVQPPVSREEYAPLIIYDGNPVEVDKEKYAAFDWDKDIYSKKKVAALLGVKKKAVKASRVVTDRAAIAIWGSKGRNGTFEVISYDAEEYNRLATNNFFQPLK